jgi:hypothetical protein
MELLRKNIDQKGSCYLIFPNIKNNLIEKPINKKILKDFKISEINVPIVKENKEIEEIKEIKEIEEIKENKEIEEIKEIKENIEVQINNNIDKNLNPIEFIKQALYLYEEDGCIKNKIFNFISDKKLMIKYTKKGVSIIMDGLTKDKWNINICKLYSFLLNIPFNYRKSIISDNTNSSNPYYCK